MNETARTGRLAVLSRRLGFDRNPLRRRTDRIESALMAGLLAGFLAGAPCAAMAAGHWSHASGLRILRAQAASRQVRAVLLQDAPDAAFMYQPVVTEWVPARWTAPGGRVHLGVVPAVSGTRAGAAIPVWVDAAGDVTGIPLTPAELARRASIATGLAPIALAVALLGVAAAARGLLRHRRLAAWETAWTAVEPLWNQRR
jgi:hypothetical protein